MVPHQQDSVIGCGKKVKRQGRQAKAKHRAPLRQSPQIQILPGQKRKMGGGNWDSDGLDPCDLYACMNIKYLIKINKYFFKLKNYQHCF